MRGTWIAALLAALMCAPQFALAQNWPGRPVTLIVPFTPVGGTPEEFAAFLKSNRELGAELAKIAKPHPA